MSVVTEENGQRLLSNTDTISTAKLVPKLLKQFIVLEVHKQRKYTTLKENLPTVVQRSHQLYELTPCSGVLLKTTVTRARVFTITRFSTVFTTTAICPCPQRNTSHPNTKPHLSKIQFNSSPPSTPSSFELFLPFMFSNRNFLSVSQLLTRYMPSLPHIP